MRDRLLDFLVCPSCKSAFKLIETSRDEYGIKEGYLKCQKCDREYPIINYVPRILPQESDDFKKTKKRTMTSFGFEWNQYYNIDVEEETMVFLKESGLKPEVFKGKLALDAGCGFGRYTYVANSFGAEVIGIDLSSAVESAIKNLKHNDKIHIVQTDIYSLPFREGQFDIVFSKGVLQHTPDPKRAFLSLVPLLKKNSFIWVWIYGNRRSAGLKTFLRKFSTKIPLPILWKLCWLSIPLGGMVRWLMKHSPPGLQKYLIKTSFFIYLDENPMKRRVNTFDWWSPHYEYFYTDDEVLKWFEEAKLKDMIVRSKSIGKCDVGIVGHK